MKLVQKWAPLEKESSFAQVRSLWGENFAALETEVEEAWENCVVMGSYTGACGESTTTVQEITLGFQPRAVLIYPQDGRITTSGGRAYGGLFSAGLVAGVGGWSGMATENGFSVKNDTYLYLNYSGKNYTYLAIR